MRWDLDSRKIQFQNSDQLLKEQKISYKHEMNNFKTILSDNQQDNTVNRALSKKYIALTIGIISIMIFVSVLFALQYF